MSPKEPSRTPAESPSLQERTDRACDAFEARLKSGGRPRLEEFLDRAPGEEKRALLRELLRLELEHRRGQGEVPRAEDYTSRFPGEADVIQRVFAEVGAPVLGSTSRPGATRPPVASGL